MNTRNRRQKIKILRYILTALLIGVVLYVVPLDEALAEVRGLRTRPLLWGLALELLQRFLFMLRWHVLLAPIGVKHTPLHTIGLGFIGLFYNNFMPSTLGGDVAKGYLLTRGHDARGTDVAASVLADRAIGLLSLVVLGIVSTALIDLPNLRLILAALSGCGIIAGAVVWVLARHHTPAHREETGGWLWRLVVRMFRKVTEVANALAQYRDHTGRLIGSFLLSCLGTVLIGIAMVFWCHAFGETLGAFEGIAITVVITIVAMIPVTVNGLGWTDGAKIVLLEMVAVGRPEALGIAVLQRVYGIVLSLLGGLLQLLPEPYGPKV